MCVFYLKHLLGNEKSENLHFNIKIPDNKKFLWKSKNHFGKGNNNFFFRILICTDRRFFNIMEKIKYIFQEV